MLVVCQPIQSEVFFFSQSVICCFLLLTAFQKIRVINKEFHHVVISLFSLFFHREGQDHFV